MKFKEFSKSDGQVSEKFLKIKDGETVMVVPRGEIYEFFFRWADKTASSTPIEGGKLRFRCNFVVYDQVQKKFVAKIMDFGVQIYDQMAEIAKHYDITETKLALSRKGATMDSTEYTMLPVGPKQQLTPAQLEQIKAVPLQLLEHSGRAPNLGKVLEVRDEDGFPPDFGDPPEENQEEEIPF